MTDVRAAAQLSALASLLTIAVPSPIACSVIHAPLALAVGLAAALLLDGLGWRIVAVMFDRERLITGTPVIRGGPPALAAIRRRARHKRTFCRRDRYWVPAPLLEPPSTRKSQPPIPGYLISGSTGDSHPADLAGHHALLPLVGRHQFRSPILYGRSFGS